MAQHIISHRAPCSCFAKKMSVQLSSEQSAQHVISWSLNCSNSWTMYASFLANPYQYRVCRSIDCVVECVTPGTAVACAESESGRQHRGRSLKRTAVWLFCRRRGRERRRRRTADGVRWRRRHVDGDAGGRDGAVCGLPASDRRPVRAARGARSRLARVVPALCRVPTISRRVVHVLRARRTSLLQARLHQVSRTCMHPAQPPHSERKSAPIQMAQCRSQCSRKRVQQLEKNVKNTFFWILKKT